MMEKKHMWPRQLTSFLAQNIQYARRHNTPKFRDMENAQMKEVHWNNYQM
jgi:hypothetical protein